jgi:hypothetical protein
VAQADVVGSTTQLINAAQTMDATTFIVATDNGILHKMRMAAPGKHFIEAPTAGNSATCKSCAHCPWMAMNGLSTWPTCWKRPTARQRDLRRSGNRPPGEKRASTACSISPPPRRPRRCRPARWSRTQRCFRDVGPA